MRIAFCGFAGEGKTTAADYLCQEHGFRKASLADPIKSMIHTFLRDQGINPKWFGKDDPIDMIPGSPSLRYLWQTLGTEWGRNLVDQEVWLQALIGRIQPPVVVDDVRFKNEADFLRQHGFWIIRIKAFGSSDDHPSESEIPDIPSHGIIHNTGNLANLHQKIDNIVEHLL